MFIVRLYTGQTRTANSYEQAQAYAREALINLGITDRSWVETSRGTRLIETAYGSHTHRWVEIVTA